MLSKYVKKYMSGYEKEVYESLLNTLDNTKYCVFPQVCMQSIISKDFDKPFKARWYIVDFLICRLPHYIPLMVVELDDKTHLREDRKNRDLELSKLIDELKLYSWHLYNYNGSIRDKYDLQQQVEYFTGIYKLRKTP